jgi:hypothetical protein
VTQLAAGIAFHGLCLAVPSEVVRSAALVAGRGAPGAADKPTPWVSVAAAANHGSAAQSGTRRVGAIPLSLVSIPATQDE